MATLDYTTIDNPFDDLLTRITVSTGLDIATDPTQGDQSGTVKTGSSLSDVWLQTWMKSNNYKPKQQGFFLDAPNGYIECMKLYVGEGGMTGGSISIPNETTSSSWHVDKEGNMWSGANVADFVNNWNSANSIIFNDGQAYFTDLHVKISYVAGVPTANSPGMEFNLDEFDTVSDIPTGNGMQRVKVNQNGLIIRNKQATTYRTLGPAGLYFQGWNSDLDGSSTDYIALSCTDDTTVTVNNGKPNRLQIVLTNRELLQIQTSLSDTTQGASNIFTVDGTVDSLHNAQGGVASLRNLWVTDNTSTGATATIFFGSYKVSPEGPSYAPPYTYVPTYENGRIMFVTNIEFNAGGAAATITPDTDKKIDLGSIVKRWSNIYTDNMTVSSTLSMSTLNVTTLGAVFLTAQSIQLIGASIFMVGGFNFTPQTLQYKDWAGTNQTMYVLGHY